MIRDLEARDIPVLVAIHEANGLPVNCLPSFENPLFVVKRIFEAEGEVAIGAFCKCNAEIFLLMNHKIGTPEERWTWLKELAGDIKREAWNRGLEDLTLWLPPELETSFSKRLIELGYQPSRWTSWTLKL